MNNSIDKKLNLILTEYADWDDIEPYRTKAVDQIKALFLERDKSLASKSWLDKYDGKIFCDCPCPGPFCNNMTHPCQKPEEHIPQDLEAIIDIKNKYKKELASKIKKLRNDTGVNEWSEGYKYGLTEILELLKEEK